MIKRFYDPHPGFAGAATRIPEPVRLRANEMDGKQYTDEEALRLIEEVMPEGCDIRLINNRHLDIEGNENYGDGMLVLEYGKVDCGTFTICQHTWRVLRWRLEPLIEESEG